MQSGICLGAVMGLAALTGFAAQGQPPASGATASVQSDSAPPYRLLQLISAGNTEQKINEAAAAGYRFLMLEPTAGAGGVTVLMARMEAGGTPYQYRLLLAEPNKDRLQRALNQAAGGGFRLVGDSLLTAPFEPRGSELLLWPWAAPEAHSAARLLNPFAGAGEKHRPVMYVAVMEKAPGASGTYDYRVSSAVRQSSVQKDLREITRQGFTPVVSTMELSSSLASLGQPRFVLVFEKNHSDAPPARAQGQYVYAKIADLPSSGDPLTELTADVAAETAVRESQTGNETDKKAETAEENNTVQEVDGATSSEEAPAKPRLQAATIAGSRLLFLSHFVYSDSAWLVAEKQPAAPPPSYRLVLRVDSAKLEEALNSAGREGFRLFTGGVVDTARRLDPRKGEVRDAKHSRQVLAVLQRDTAANKYQYRILHADDVVALLKQMNDVATQGYGFAYMWGNNVVLERVSTDSAAKGRGL
jgi:hypothetical protein